MEETCSRCNIAVPWGRRLMCGIIPRLHAVSTIRTGESQLGFVLAFGLSLIIDNLVTPSLQAVQRFCITTLLSYQGKFLRREENAVSMLRNANIWSAGIN